MQSINREIFFQGYREHFGALKQEQVTGLNIFLDGLESDKSITNDLAGIRIAAYFLATAMHENTWGGYCSWSPIEERGKLSYFDKYEPGTPIGNRLGNKIKGDGYKFRGRAWPHLTGRSNYSKASVFLGIDLVSNPEKANDPYIAYKILSWGMFLGTFTSKKITDYIHGAACKYLSARRVINGTDQAEHIENIAYKFEEILINACR